MKPRRSADGLSRRFVVGAAGSIALSAGTGAGSAQSPAKLDPIATIGNQLLAMSREEKNLAGRWSRIEGWLIEYFGWADLSEEEQRDLPEAKELHEIDAQLDGLEDQRRQHRARLLELPAANLEGTLWKLKVVADTITAVENWTAHHLLKAAIEELEALAANAERT